MMWRVLAFAAMFCLGWSSAAQAGFLVPLFFGAAFAATTAGVILSGVVTLAASFGLSYVASQFMSKRQQQAPQLSPSFGTQLNLRVDADVPCSFILGTASTAGSSVYFATYGKNGTTENSNLIEIIALSDLPCTALRRVYVDGTPAVLTDSGTDRGSIVQGFTGSTVGSSIAALEASVGGSFLGIMAVASGVLDQLRAQVKIQEYADLLAIRWFDGTQTAADSFAVSALSARETQPWTNQHVGWGTAYVRAHSVYDPEKVPGRVNWRFVVDGIPLYDPRKDSSVVGGSGTHRFNDLSTHEFSNNLAVMIYNVCRGIYKLDDDGNRVFVYGMENTTADQFPLDIWFAAMNECDATITLADDTTEKQYTGGAEVTFDKAPLDTIKEFLKACGGRFVEIGGIYKLFVGAPGLSVLSVTDGGIVASMEEHLKPVTPLLDRLNYITGKYTSIDDGYLPKIAPVRQNTDWQDEDGRRLSADLDVQSVQSSRQMQQLMDQMLSRSRRERKHILPLPPIAFGLEPGDVIDWTSATNNYDAKLFEIDGVDYQPNLITVVSVTEVDPADFDWSSDKQIAETPGQFISLRPTPKVVVGFDAAGFVWRGDNSTERPAIKITWEPPEDNDIVSVRWQVRTAADTSNVMSGSTARADVLAGQVIIVGSLQAVTEYEVRARFESFNGFAADWSLWIPVTTPDARIGKNDLSAELQAFLLDARTTYEKNIDKTLNQLAALQAELDADAFLGKDELRRDLVRSIGQVTAAYQEAITVAVGPESAIAQSLTALQAAIDNVQSTLNVRFIVGVTPSGAIAAYELQATAQEANAGMQIVAFDDGMGGAFSTVRFEADRFYVGSSAGGGVDFMAAFIVDTTVTPNRIILNADIIAPGSITADKLNVNKLTAISADIGDATVTGKWQSAGTGPRLVHDFANALSYVDDGVP